MKLIVKTCSVEDRFVIFRKGLCNIVAARSPSTNRFVNGVCDMRDKPTSFPFLVNTFVDTMSMYVYKNPNRLFRRSTRDCVRGLKYCVSPLDLCVNWTVFGVNVTRTKVNSISTGNAKDTLTFCGGGGNVSNKPYSKLHKNARICCRQISNDSTRLMYSDINAESPLKLVFNFIMVSIDLGDRCLYNGLVTAGWSRTDDSCMPVTRRYIKKQSGVLT